MRVAPDDHRDYLTRQFPREADSFISGHVLIGVVRQKYASKKAQFNQRSGFDANTLIYAA
jgi:hypothetical protein